VAWLKPYRPENGKGKICKNFRWKDIDAFWKLNPPYPLDQLHPATRASWSIGPAKVTVKPGCRRRLGLWQTTVPDDLQTLTRQNGSARLVHRSIIRRERSKKQQRHKPCCPPMSQNISRSRLVEGSRRGPVTCYSSWTPDRSFVGRR
jgi:hypothetical protein